MDSEWLFGSDIFEFMKRVQNSDDKEETDSLLLAASESYECNATTCPSEPIASQHWATTNNTCIAMSNCKLTPAFLTAFPLFLHFFLRGGVQ